eukprot:CAMPEP_0113374734 /NCGR_PEP_ID=MMETSP0013_2-20120614/1739_1 /TAXON_ID=2843 ORGANISM="Skeletonema costatum, Strain 1716" /NCGR_SAMPLE_ID=MMETSP0013_2 /ASSEMBLY_ACC=CAM_ASM_000158 /LENGTH=788 /DNA_ID=CAMNT_0000256739 /DNA_START=44 /DNA_END=2410 /DNA_ORIENTATION=+ /assembly_acc=CAM_ASM_000158
MKMFHAAHSLLVTAAAGAVVQSCFAFIVHSKGRNTFLPTQQHTQPSSSSHLFYYKSDEPFSERLNQVQSELESVKDEGLQQFVMDELLSAEEKLSFASKVSDSDRNEIRLAKQILKGALKQGREIANEVKEVKRGFDELQAAKILEGATEDIVAKDVFVEKDLEKVMESVATALKDAEEVLRTAVFTAASQDGFTDEVKESIVQKLELSAKTVEETIKVADSAAKTAKQMVINDDVALAQMEKTAIKLADAIETTETLTTSLEGSYGGAEVDALADSLKIASDEMVNDLTAVDNIAAAVTRKIEVQADAVLDMDKKAGQAVGTINAAKTSIEQSNSETDKAALKTSLQESVDKIQVDENAAEELAKAITSDANTDAAAEQVISDADHVFDELIESVKETVDEVVSDYDSGEDMDDADAISEELDTLASDEEEAEKAIKSLEEAEEKVSESAVEELHEEQIKSEAAKEVKHEAAPEVAEPPKEDHIKSEAAKEVKTEAPEIVEPSKEQIKSEAAQEVKTEAPKEIKSETAKEVKTEAAPDVAEPPKEEIKTEVTKEEVTKEVKTEAPKQVESKPGSDSAAEKTTSEAPSPKQVEPKESVQASDDNVVTTTSTEVEKADTVEKSASTAPELSDVKQIQDDKKIENVKLPEETTTKEVGGGESIADSHEVITASADHVQKVDVSQEVIAPSSASPTIESSGNVAGDVADNIKAVVTSNAEKHAGDAADHMENLKTGIASASNVVEELASKTIAAGDSLAGAIDSADTAAPVAESVAQAVAGVVTTFSFLPF